MEISIIKKKLEGVKDLQEFHPREIWEMLESAMEHIELLEEEASLLKQRAIDPPSAPSLPSTGTYSRPMPEIVSTNSAGN